MGKRELECINFLLSSIGVTATVEKRETKYFCFLSCCDCVCCGIITSDLMKIRKYLVNKISKLCLTK